MGTRRNMVLTDVMCYTVQLVYIWRARAGEARDLGHFGEHLCSIATAIGFLGRLVL